MINSDRPHPVVLDTDLGSDVDDILALAVILGSPELRLHGVTTVYGDVVLRARMTARAMRGRRRGCARRSCPAVASRGPAGRSGGPATRVP